MKKIIVIFLSLIVISCAPARRNWSQEKTERKIEKGIKKGMRYNHKCVNREKELKLKNIDQ